MAKVHLGRLAKTGRRRVGHELEGGGMSLLKVLKLLVLFVWRSALQSQTVQAAGGAGGKLGALERDYEQSIQ